MEPSGERRVELNKPDVNASHSFCGNHVVTSKYTLINFLPKFLFEAFSKFANAYFFLVCVLQMVPSVTITNGVPYNALPLSVVLSVEAIASVLEDRRRQKDDRVANSSKTRVVRPDGSLDVVAWHQVKVGDIVKLQNRDAIPSDCFILATSDSPPAAVCYVETKSLDGETNLKLRQGIEDVAIRVDQVVQELKSAGSVPDDQVYDKAISQFRGTVKAEAVNNHIHQFTGAAKVFHNSESAPEDWTPLNVNHMLLRGCILRNTDFAYLLVVNTGHDTKIMQNSHSTKNKLSLLDKSINRNILLFVLAEILLCVLAAYLSREWNVATGEFAYYLRPEPYDAGDFVSTVFTFFLLIANMIPISLYVTMKFARFFQSFFIFWDLEMRFEGEDPSSGEPMSVPAKVRTMDLNDSLGEVSYIFSDKTGTLTNNVMEFRKCSIGGVVYGTGTTVIGAAALERQGLVAEAQAAKESIKASENDPHPRYVNFKDSDEQSNSLVSLLLGPSSEQRKRARNFISALALCHSVLVERVRDENGDYTGETRLSASSPDDQALVAAAGEFGFTFSERADGGKTIVLNVSPPSEYVRGARKVRSSMAQRGTQAQRYELVEILEFTSKRKRMSVVVREPSGVLKLICKGADSEIYKRLNKRMSGMGGLAQKTEDDLLEFANDGLRTLAIAGKELDEPRFNEWHRKYKAAIADLAEMEKQQNKEPNKIDTLMDEMEANLELYGATAIEDKLQNGVPETIHTLADGGVKIWVLTGDKEETAINIGYACQLLDNTMTQMIINHSSGDTVEEISVLLDELNREANAHDTDGEEGDSPLALIIDGDALKLALHPVNEMELLRLARRCKAVVACRTSPKQKSEIVALVKNNIKFAKTLAIGDGANDVSMIQTAHIGIGISGQEGLQAVNSSDYAIGQFRYLERLLLVHGRYNYRRMAKLVTYMFYKNILLILTQLWWAYFSGFSGQKFYLEMGLQSYNLIYTNFLIFFLSIYDVDLPGQVVIENPKLYQLGVQGKLFNFWVFWQSVLNGVYQSVIIFAVTQLLWIQSAPDLWMRGAIVFTIVCTVANFNASLVQSSWHWSNWVAFFFSMLSWPAMAFMFETSFFLEVFTTDFGRDWLAIFSTLLSSTNSWLVIVLAVVAANLRDFAWKGMKRAWFPEPYHIFQEKEKLQPSNKVYNKAYSKASNSEEVVISVEMPETSERKSSSKRQSSKRQSARRSSRSLAPHTGAMMELDDSTEHKRASMIRRGSLQRLSVENPKHSL